MAHRGLQHQSWAHWYPQHCPGHLSRGISSTRRKQLNCKPVVDVCRLINTYSVQAQVIRKTQCTCLQATPDLVSCSSSALVSHGRNLTASLAMVWWVHVTPSKCWQAGHLNAGWAKSFGTCLLVDQVQCWAEEWPGHHFHPHSPAAAVSVWSSAASRACCLGCQ